MKEFHCLCENLVQVDFPEEVNLTEKPEVMESILAGNFMSVTCERCGKLLKPEFPVRVRNNEGSFDYFLVPELERSAFLLGKLDYDYPHVVIGYDELVERLLLYRAGLNEGAVEIVKYYMLERLMADEQVSIAFHEKKGSSLSFYIQGLKEGEIGVKDIPLAFYERVLASLPEKSGEEPFREIITPPYISVKKIALEEEQV